MVTSLSCAAQQDDANWHQSRFPPPDICNGRKLLRVQDLSLFFFCFFSSEESLLCEEQEILHLHRQTDGCSTCGQWCHHVIFNNGMVLLQTVRGVGQDTDCISEENLVTCSCNLSLSLRSAGVCPLIFKFKNTSFIIVMFPLTHNISSWFDFLGFFFVSFTFPSVSPFDLWKANADQLKLQI